MIAEQTDYRPPQTSDVNVNTSVRHVQDIKPILDGLRARADHQDKSTFREIKMAFVPSVLAGNYDPDEYGPQSERTPLTQPELDHDNIRDVNIPALKEKVAAIIENLKNFSQPPQGPTFISILMRRATGPALTKEQKLQFICESCESLSQDCKNLLHNIGVNIAYLQSTIEYASRIAIYARAAQEFLAENELAGIRENAQPGSPPDTSRRDRLVRRAASLSVIHQAQKLLIAETFANIEATAAMLDPIDTITTVLYPAWKIRHSGSASSGGIARASDVTSDRDFLNILSTLHNAI